MSILSIFDFLKGVLSLFISNFPRFAEALRKKIPSPLEKPLDEIIDVVNIIKTYVGSPLAELVVKSTNTVKDDAVRNWLEKNIPEVLTDLGFVKDNVFELPGEESVKGAHIRSIVSSLTQKYTDMPQDQAAITSAALYASKNA